MDEPRPGQGIPLWGKIALGCVAVVVLGMATCVGGGYLLFRKGADLIEGVANENWAEMRRAVDQMMTDEGARRLYAEQTGLARSFPTEEEFLETVRRWRPQLEPMPEQIPILRGRLNLNKQFIDGTPRTELSYENGKGARIRFTWERGVLIQIDVGKPGRLSRRTPFPPPRDTV